MSRDIKTTEYKAKNFIRTGGGISFEERAPQPSDFTDARGYAYAEEFAKSPTTFAGTYKQWQQFADCFIMRRPIITISGSQQCETKTFKAREIEKHTKVGFVSVADFAIPGSDRDSIPNGKYQLVSMNWNDQQNGYTVVNVTYQQYGEWELLKLISPAPNPKGTST